METCTVITKGERCAKKLRARGWCNAHYLRWMKTGDVEADKPLDYRNARISPRPNSITDHPHYRLWSNVKDRCFNPRSKSYKDYGGRGITICGEWLNDARAFITWIEENLGPRPDGMSLDRINNDGNYEPGNLRWANRTTQAVNRRRGWGRSGANGVYESKRRRDGSQPSWHAVIRVNGKRYSAGPCDTMEEAIELRDLLEKALRPTELPV